MSAMSSFSSTIIGLLLVSAMAAAYPTNQDNFELMDILEQEILQNRFDAVGKQSQSNLDALKLAFLQELEMNMETMDGNIAQAGGCKS